MYKPAEKAKDLVGKFDESLNYLTSGTSGIEKYIYERAVSCAIIAVDEMLEEIGKLRKPEYTTFVLRYAAYKKGTTEVEDEGESCDGYELIEFWQNVKEEINKL